MKNKVKYFCLILLGVASTNTILAQSDSTIYKEILKTIETSKAKYATDKRTKIIEVGNADLNNNKFTIQTTEKNAIPFLKENLKAIKAEVEYAVFPDSSVSQNPYGIVTLSVANMRTKPGHASEMATQALLGTQVDILQKVKGEFRVRTPEGYISWVPSSSIAPMNLDQLQKWKSSKKIIYTSEFGKSYSKPDLTSLRVSDLVYGDILMLNRTEANFYEASYPDGRIAYITKSEAIDFDHWLKTRNLNADNIINSAKTMLGLPYLWGGTSVKGVDCSGFTKTAYFMNGYIVPRDASQQVLAGDQIDILDNDGHFDSSKALKNLKPADLLFFAAGKSSNPNARVTHVALYIGNGEFIHSAGTVRINSMLKDAKNYDDFQTRTVVAARRYIGAQDLQIQKIQLNSYYTK